MAQEKLKSIDINNTGFTGMQRYTNSYLNRPELLYEAINVNLFKNLGVVQSCNGYTLYKSISGALQGLYGHMDNTGTGIIVIASGTTLYTVVSGTVTASNITGLTVGKKAEFTSFLNRCFMVNGSQQYSTSDGLTWDTTNLSAGATGTAAPVTAKYIEHFGTRLIMADNTSVFWSSLPQGNAPYTLNWDTAKQYVIVETDDGDTITGLKRLRKALLIFKNFYVQRLNITGDYTADLMPISEEVGSPSGRSVLTYENKCYFFGTTKDGEAGIFITDGANIRLISRPVQDIIYAIPQSQYTSVCAGINKGILKWYIGDVTINTDTIDKRTIRNCELQFSPRDQAWQIRSLNNSVTIYSPLKAGTNRALYFGDTVSGKLYQDETGIDFSGTAINSEVTSNFFTFSDLDENSTIRQLWIDGDDLDFIQVLIRSTDNYTDWIPVADNLKSRKDLFKGLFNLTGSQFQVKVVWTRPGVWMEKFKCKSLPNISEIS